jgi:hypothetical protein
LAEEHPDKLKELTDLWLEEAKKFEFTGGRIVKVVFDVADDAYIDVERELAAAMARD